jgi:hypothetical protein
MKSEQTSILADESTSAFASNDKNSIKQKYLDQAENELHSLQEKELDSLRNLNLNGDTTEAQSDLTTKPPKVDRTLKPKNNSMRQIVVPKDLPNAFLQKAEENTRKNIETCGILAGSLVNCEKKSLMA